MFCTSIRVVLYLVLFSWVLDLWFLFKTDLQSKSSGSGVVFQYLKFGPVPHVRRPFGPPFLKLAFLGHTREFVSYLFTVIYKI